MVTRSLSESVKREVKRTLGPAWPKTFGPARHRKLRDEYRVHDLLVQEGPATPDVGVPLRWWPVTPNFGDLLSPWLIEQMTGMPAVAAQDGKPTYVMIGSVLKRVPAGGIVWGTGSFGNEHDGQISVDADYRAVRGPLTRAKILNVGGKCPRVYGDPALLAPLYYFPQVPKTHEIGLVLRWSEHKRLASKVGPGVKLIDLGTDDVAGVLDDILSCRRIVTSSLHGLIIADAYGIPSAPGCRRTHRTAASSSSTTTSPR